MSKERTIHNIIWDRWWNVLYSRTTKMEETQRENTEANKKRICRYGLEIESCRQCLFEALCHYQDNKWDDTAEVDQIS